MKIGLVDLDTSHPASWIPILREYGHEIVGVVDHGNVHPQGYADKFASEHNIPAVFSDLATLADACDAAIVHSCNWDANIARAEPFVQHGKAVLIDKPLAGNRRDLDQLLAWSAQGARVTGGSALRFCQEIQAFLARDVSDRGSIETAFVACGVDEFNYGIHAYSMLLGLMGPGVESVRCLGSQRQRRVQVNWADGRAGFVVVGTMDQWLPYAATVITNRCIEQMTPKIDVLYRALLDATLPYLAGQTEAPPVAMAELLLPERCALAAMRSWCEGDRVVRLDEPDAGLGYDGPAFAAAYQRQRYPQK